MIAGERHLLPAPQATMIVFCTKGLPFFLCMMLCWSTVQNSPSAPILFSSLSVFSSPNFRIVLITYSIIYSALRGNFVFIPCVPLVCQFTYLISILLGPIAVQFALLAFPSLPPFSTAVGTVGVTTILIATITSIAINRLALTAACAKFLRCIQIDLLLLSFFAVGLSLRGCITYSVISTHTLKTPCRASVFRSRISSKLSNGLRLTALGAILEIGYNTHVVSSPVAIGRARGCSLHRAGFRMPEL